MHVQKVEMSDMYKVSSLHFHRNKDVTLLHALSENVTHFNYKEGGDTRIS